MLKTVFRYALADIWDDRMATALTIALFTVIMAPPALLYAAKASLISTWTAEIARDVSNREVIIRGGKASNEWITVQDMREIASWPETGFIAPEPSFSVRAHDWALMAEGEFLPSQSSYRVLSLRTSLPGASSPGGCPGRRTTGNLPVHPCAGRIVR